MCIFRYLIQLVSTHGDSKIISLISFLTNAYFFQPSVGGISSIFTCCFSLLAVSGFSNIISCSCHTLKNALTIFTSILFVKTVLVWIFLICRNWQIDFPSSTGFNVSFDKYFTFLKFMSMTFKSSLLFHLACIYCIFFVSFLQGLFVFVIIRFFHSNCCSHIVTNSFPIPMILFWNVHWYIFWHSHIQECFAESICRNHYPFHFAPHHFVQLFWFHSSLYPLLSF